MKSVLIVGKNSFIGTSFARYAGSRYKIQTVDARDGKWKDADFSNVDAVLYCAGIAHVAQKKYMRQLYYDINCGLAVDVATHAKGAGVKQFVFLSSMAVYGSGNFVIRLETEPNATDFYGGSKLAAEEKLRQLVLPDSGFNLCIVRPPMVYGYGCKGNFPRLVKLAKKL
ncbi:MAG: NAD-dependent epimerase/dehydratase family protein, partial [Firmicutes bacterium]|nr:NAD-dependent epimerase/dehydratase family protein [Bacillota bacterium]